MIRKLLVLLTFVAGLTLSNAANAQQPDAGTAPQVPLDDGGNPIYGYLAFGALAGIAIMVLCRSSRRS